MFRESNLKEFANSVTEFVKPFMTKPVTVIVLLGVFLISTSFLSNILATPFGIGLILGVVATFYMVANYMGKDKKATPQAKSKSSSKK